MIIRAALCALDWNWNVDRPQKLDELGEAQWKEKVQFVFFFFLDYSALYLFFGKKILLVIRILTN